MGSPTTGITVRRKGAQALRHWLDDYRRNRDIDGEYGHVQAARILHDAAKLARFQGLTEETAHELVRRAFATHLMTITY